MAEVKKRFLDVAGYMDNLLWGKQENSKGESVKYGVFPFTRYGNVLNRPRVISEEGNIAATANGDFHVVVTDIEDVSEDDVFKLFRQNW